MAAQFPIEAGPASEAPSDLHAIAARLELLAGKMRSFTGAHEKPCATVADSYRRSAVNLLHYLALRQTDVRGLQQELARAGLSSLGRAESHVMASVQATLNVARAASGLERDQQWGADWVSFDDGVRLLKEHTEALLGSSPAERYAHIMVTMPAEGAADYSLVRDLLIKGVTCIRINCAHDDATIWSAIIDHVRAAEKETSRSCRVLMDLGGPKLRTCAVPPGPAVIKVRPKRDSCGNVQEPARIWLVPIGDRSPAPMQCAARLELPAEWIQRLGRGHVIRLRDARGAKRKWVIVRKSGHAYIAETSQTNYLTEKTCLEHRKGHSQKRFSQIRHVPRTEGYIVLAPGDHVLLDATVKIGQPVKKSGARIVAPARISCTLPEVLKDVRAGEEVWFDDGRIGGVIEEADSRVARIRITHASAKGEKLRDDKGVNLPDTRLRVPALTDKDLEDLRFVAQHADMVGLSFVTRPEDVYQVQRALQSLTTRQVGIVLKIETQRAFQGAPALILAAMRRAPCGVMIARGDLAVECGFERLAEVQEELLWLCEAAHMPVIWATQVLDTLAKSGRASRAEITDAAMGDRAECVMLNKGPHILAAVAALDDILSRMQGHQFKKTSRLRPLHVASLFTRDPAP